MVSPGYLVTAVQPAMFKAGLVLLRVLVSAILSIN